MAITDTPVLNRLEIGRFWKFERLLMPFGNQVAVRADNFRTPCQGCPLGWLNLKRTPELAKTGVRSVRRLEIDIFSVRPKMSFSGVLRSEMEQGTSRRVLEGILCDILTGHPGKNALSLRPDGVRKKSRFYGSCLNRPPYKSRT